MRTPPSPGEVRILTMTFLPETALTSISARFATLGRSQDVCKGSRFTVEDERFVVSGLSLLTRLEVNEQEAESISGNISSMQEPEHMSIAVPARLSDSSFWNKSECTCVLYLLRFVCTGIGGEGRYVSPLCRFLVGGPSQLAILVPSSASSLSDPDSSTASTCAAFSNAAAAAFLLAAPPFPFFDAFVVLAGMVLLVALHEDARSDNQT